MGVRQHRSRCGWLVIFQEENGFAWLWKGGDILAIFLMLETDKKRGGMGLDCVQAVRPHFVTIA